MKEAKTFTFLLIFIFCINISVKAVQQITDSIEVIAEDQDNIYRNCVFSNNEFAYEIDSCNCGDIYTTHDTIYIDLFQAIGGEIQGHLLKINYPKCDSSFFILMKHQNRFWTSSMGPDPLYTNWILYNSPYDTVFYDTKRKGFYIDTISRIEQEKFPKFDTLDFYEAYKRAVEENLNLNYVPNIAKNALYQEYIKNKDKIEEILIDSDVELHRIFLVLKQGNSTMKVIVFTYGHFG